MDSTRKILIADPNLDFQHYLATALDGQDDLEVVGTATDGYGAVNLTVAMAPDVLLMDTALPKMDGLGVLRALNDSALENKPQVIILSSYLTEFLEKQAAALGAQYFLVKPFEVSSLLYLLRYNTEKPKQPAKPVDAKREITNMLMDLGVPTHIKGFYYLREAVSFSMGTSTGTRMITKRIYPQVAEQYFSTPSRVERAIRHAIEVAWKRGDLDTLYGLFRNTVSSERGKPTNSEFISAVAERMRLDETGRRYS